MSSTSSARRSFLKLLVATPLFATIATRSFAATVASGVGKAVGNPYARLGVRTIINARGTYTYLSGCLELPEVRRAAEAASHYFVDLYELQAAAGKRLAALSGAESGIVTAGAADAGVEMKFFDGVQQRIGLELVTAGEFTYRLRELPRVDGIFDLPDDECFPYACG